ncbi:MAG: ABC transporter permease [Candidatus Njordarchaeia archaeon]
MIVFIILVIISALDLMIPIVLASLGEVLTEKSGIVNIGLEGIMLMSALVAVYATEVTKSWFMGYFIAGLFGAFLGLIHAFISVYLNGDQIVSGIGLNIIGIGFTPFMIVAIWHVAGQHTISRSLTVPRIGITMEDKFISISPMVFLAIILVVLAHFIMTKTNWGLIIKASGENPEAVEVIGIDVRKVRTVVTTVGGFLTGLSGAFLSIDTLGVITKDISAGRGFLALANVVFSRWEPLLVLLGGFVFGIFEAIAIRSEIIGLRAIIPDYFLKMIPYIATLIIVAGFIGKARAPKSLGEPYVKE